MTGENEPVQHCTVAEQADLVTALEAAAIEHLDVDDHRTIVIYRSAVVMLIVTEGQVTAARAFDVELWNPPAQDSDRDPGELLTAFIDELLTVAETIRC